MRRFRAAKLTYQAIGEVTTGVRNRLELFGESTRQEVGQHVEQIDGFCQRLDDVSSEGRSLVARSFGSVADQLVSRRAASATRAQSDDLATMSQTVTSTLSDLKTRSAQAVEYQDGCTSRLLSKVSLVSLIASLLGS